MVSQLVSLYGSSADSKLLCLGCQRIGGIIVNDYAQWYVEIHPYQIGFEVTRKVAAHLAMRITMGSAIVVCDKPRNMLSTFHKRWNHVLRIIENERAATIGNHAKAELKTYQVSLEHAQFMIGQPQEITAPTIWLVEPDDLSHIPKGVMTIYVMSELPLSQLLHWARQMEDDSNVLLFRKQPLAAAAQGAATR